MVEPKMILTPDSWKMLGDDERGWIIYNTVNDLIERIHCIENRCVHCYNGRFFSKTIGFIGGFLGGIIGFFSSKIFHS